MTTPRSRAESTTWTDENRTGTWRTVIMSTWYFEPSHGLHPVRLSVRSRLQFLDIVKAWFSVFGVWAWLRFDMTLACGGQTCRRTNCHVIACAIHTERAVKYNSHDTTVLYQWLNYSKVGGGTLYFFPSLSFPSLPQSSSLLFPSVPPMPLEIGRTPFQWLWASAVISPSGVLGGAPAEIVFGAFKPLK